jgi:hypothetical protein
MIEKRAVAKAIVAIIIGLKLCFNGLHLEPRPNAAEGSCIQVVGLCPSVSRVDWIPLHLHQKRIPSECSTHPRNHSHRYKYSWT